MNNFPMVCMMLAVACAETSGLVALMATPMPLQIKAPLVLGLCIAIVGAVYGAVAIARDKL